MEVDALLLPSIMEEEIGEGTRSRSWWWYGGGQQAGGGENQRGKKMAEVKETNEGPTCWLRTPANRRRNRQI
jgi:hypothetical protein